ncbi:MAG: type II secretion system protein N [Candidatus Omnitrophica bacterium]|nr:type II secretion system protein N [Candidatus Omnitrophota bacterium]MDD5310324.1 type II secretion system protein N [Candidatus Omnitrophota bacterium]
MPEEFTSPEEKLLRLIRGEKKPKNRPAPLQERESSVPGEREAGPAPAGQDRRTAPPQLKSGDHVKFINITLITVLIVIAAVLLIDVISFNLKRPAYIPEPAKGAAVRQEPQIGSASPVQADPSSVSVEIQDNPALLASKDLFKASPVQAAPAARPAQASFDKLKDFTLKGIIAGDKPQVILEDGKNKKSYFLYKGDSLDNIRVEDIQSDKVILSINGEVLELTL